MAEEPERTPSPEGGQREPGGVDSPESEGGEGARNAETTPPISEEGEHGQTAVDAGEDAERSSDEQTRREE